MGCCQSTSSASSPEASRARDDDRAAAAPRLVAIASAAGVAGAGGGAGGASGRHERRISNASSPRDHSAERPSSQSGEPRPNAPLRPPSPVKRSPGHNPRHPRPWSRGVLEQERQDFFDTRVTGRPEVWSALHLLCGMLRDGNLEGAQTVLDAAGLTCPTGRVASSAASTSRSGRRSTNRRAEGVYDDRGELYEIPNWIVRDPNDVVNRDSEKEDGEMWESKAEADEQDSDHDDSHDDEDDRGSSGDGSSGSVDGAAEARKQYTRSPSKRTDSAIRPESKGKGRVADEGQPMQLRARLSHAEALTVRDVLINVGTRTKVSVLVRRIMDHLDGDGAKPPGRLRIVYLGQSWDDSSRTVEQNGYREGTVVQVMILPAWDT